jgi:hypothetical protein
MQDIDEDVLWIQACLKNESKWRLNIADKLNNTKLGYKSKHVRTVVEWMISCFYYRNIRLTFDTASLGIHIFYRTLLADTTQDILKEKLQLIAITCLMISQKFLDTIYLSCEDWVGLTKNAYTIEQLHESEITVLKLIDFKMHGINHATFYTNWWELKLFGKWNENGDVLRLARWLMFLMMEDYDVYSTFYYSHVTLSCCLVAVHTTDTQEKFLTTFQWKEWLQKTGMTLEVVRGQLMLSCLNFVWETWCLNDYCPKEAKWKENFPLPIGSFDWKSIIADETRLVMIGDGTDLPAFTDEISQGELFSFQQHNLH